MEGAPWRRGSFHTYTVPSASLTASSPPLALNATDLTLEWW